MCLILALCHAQITHGAGLEAGGTFMRIDLKGTMPVAGDHLASLCGGLRQPWRIVFGDCAGAPGI